MDNSTPAMFAMRIVAVNRHVRGKRYDIGKEVLVRYVPEGTRLG